MKVYIYKYLITLSCVMVFLSPVWLTAQVDTAWVRRYSGPGATLDRATAIVVDNIGNVCVTGYSHGVTTDFDYATIKYYPNGDTIWVRRYNGTGDNTDVANAIAIDNFGNVYVTGRSHGIDASYDYTTVKYLPNGDTAWVRRYSGPGNDDRARAITVDNAGNVYVTGESYGSGSQDDYATIKYYPNGDTIWVRRYNGPGNATDEANAITVDDSGNVYVTGHSEGVSTEYDYTTIKYLPNGDVVWVRHYNGPGNWTDEANAITVDDVGNVYVTGVSDGSDTDFDYATIKYYPNGDTVWVRRYNGPGNGPDLAYALAIDNTGNVYVTGYSYDFGTGRDYTTIKYQPNGDTAWVRMYNGPGNNEDWAWALAVDDSSNVYVTGESYSSGSQNDYATIKYYPNGNTAWVIRYDGTSHTYDCANAIAVDNACNVYVTGRSHGMDGTEDYATIKYVQTPGVEEENYHMLEPHNVIKTIFSGSILCPSDKSAKVFDITGREIETFNPAPGIYFIEVDGKITRKVVKVR